MDRNFEHRIWERGQKERENIEKKLIKETGLSLSDLPDGLPIEEFVDDKGNFDFDAISAW